MAAFSQHSGGPHGLFHNLRIGVFHQQIELAVEVIGQRCNQPRGLEPHSPAVLSVLVDHAVENHSGGMDVLCSPGLARNATVAEQIEESAKSPRLSIFAMGSMLW